MSSSIYTDKGLSLIEVLIALFLISIGIFGLLSLQPSAWRLSDKSDLVGRAGGILHKELEASELLIMNPNYANPCSGSNPLITTKNVYASGQGAMQPGDVPLAVQTTIRDNQDGTWSVRVSVTWPGNATGISETRIVTRQEFFRS
jgi:prepilin-type N-terminal cleavage/methylation domain-containing protein